MKTTADHLNLNNLKSLLGLSGTEINLGGHLPESLTNGGAKQ
jgi:hypothetical protein